jgi:hypothetical protein
VFEEKEGIMIKGPPTLYTDYMKKWEPPTTKEKVTIYIEKVKDPWWKRLWDRSLTIVRLK